MSQQDENPKPEEKAEPRGSYDWPSIALFAIFLGAFIYALLRR